MMIKGFSREVKVNLTSREEKTVVFKGQMIRWKEAVGKNCWKKVNVLGEQNGKRLHGKK